MNFHYHLLINQAAGAGNGKKISEKIEKLFLKNNFLYTAHRTNYPNHELEIVTQLVETTLVPWSDRTEAPYPLLIVLGGDGTLHQVVNQLKQLDVQVPVAYIPAGSGNDFARGINLPKEIEQIFWRIIQTQEPQELPIIAYEEKIQERKGIGVNNVGIGLDAAIVARTNHSTAKYRLNKYNLGSLSYIMSILAVLFKQKGFPILVEANGQTIGYKKAFLCTTTNHPYFGGGIAIAPMADVNKHSLDFILVERLPFYKIIWLIWLLLRKKQANSKYFHHISATKIRIVSTTPQFAQADGEELGRGPYDLQFSLEKQFFWF